MSNNTVPGSSFKVPGSGSQNPEPRTENPEPIRFWRTRDELSGDAAFRERLHNEFPSEVEAITDETSRRAFMKLMGASIALAGLTACTRQPDEVIVPYVRQPEELIPGKPQFYATTMAVGGMVTGLLVESHEGRPTKIEGNPLHPESLGACDVFAQAAILGLYDPDRARTLSQLGEIRPWSAFLGAIRAAVAAQQPLQGSGIRILTETVSSPTLAAQIRELLARFPSAKWHQWDPAGLTNTRAGARLAFDDDVKPLYRLDRADVIVALDADFLGGGPGALAHARAFASRRRPEQADRMNRLYAIESMPTLTGSRADHRFPVRPSAIPDIARALAAALGAGNVPRADVTLPEGWPQRINAIARDLQAHHGSSLVIAGETQPPYVHAVAHLMNQMLGNIGATVVYVPASDMPAVDEVASLRELTADMDAGHVDLLLILGGNPVYTAPADVPFTQALGKVQTRVHLSLYADETSELCHWQIPQAHFLEAWSDARAFDGTASIVQPLIAPLYAGHSAHEVLAAMSDRPERPAHDLVREYWIDHPVGANVTRNEQGAPTPEFERTWRKWLHDGVIPLTAATPRTVTVKTDRVAEAAAAGAAPGGSGFEIAFRLDPAILDGRFSNNGWLQELPKPITKLTWDNAVMVSPATLDKLKAINRLSMQGGEHGQVISDIVGVNYQGKTVRGAVFAVPGHPDDCVTIHLGYGRTRAGQVGNGAGFNAYAIRTSTALWAGRGADVVATGDTYSLACTQYHHLMEGRGMVRVATRDEFVKDPTIVHKGFEAPPRTLTLYPDFKYDGYKWGMAIDVNSCIGCNACVVGCQSENNIPVIGKEQVLRGREMHWIRVDTYYSGETQDPETYFQPVPCMQCENAPCEVVCPVGATVHSHEGLNDMVYNRCVGTRYCSNNCPYKVRRFNYLLYQDFDTPSLKLGRNPDVTVRSRGVMEKCTYCVQRINAAKIDSEKAGRKIADGEIKTACQQTCPADAIVFGDLNDPKSRVAQLQAEERNYSILADLNTRPRTTYLAAVRNVNPEIGE
jgi:molybdopterin-containing oxidoreductase family iron-sulfur binding subunit